MDNLRFLVQKNEEKALMAKDALMAEKPVQRLNERRANNPERVNLPILLELVTSSTKLKDDAAYVVVSYCWNRGKAGWFAIENVRSIEITARGDLNRPSAVPPEVLSRAVIHAQSHNISAIWIDQECIDQKDPVEKEIAIQAMDFQYQKSEHPIAILEFYFETQDELDAFASITDPNYGDFDPSDISVLAEVLDKLAHDQWFTRAWTLQEATAAGVTMKLLMGCPGLQKPDHFGPSDSEFEITIWDFQEAMVHARNLIEGYLAEGVWEDDEDAIHASNCADLLWNLIPTIVPDFDVRALRKTVSHRQECNAAEAVTFLRTRKNSHFPDRLAILANMCNYVRRVPTTVLDEPGCSFSVCAVTLAIINGDMSLLTGYGDDSTKVRDSLGEDNWEFTLAPDCRALGPVYECEDDSLLPISYGFSWGPKPSGSLGDIIYMEERDTNFRLQPSTLSSHGLDIYGVLWEMNNIIYVPQTQECFADKWVEELELQSREEPSAGRERQQALTRDFIWCLFRELSNQGYLDLVKTLWLKFQPLGLNELGYSSYGRPRPYNFEDIFELKSKLGNSHIVVKRNIKNELRASRLYVDPTSRGLHRPTVERQLISQVCRRGQLTCGIAVSQSNQNEPRVWFEGTKAGELIFTPHTSLGDEVFDSAYESEAISWRVENRPDADDNKRLLQCLGRRGGYWRFGDLKPVKFTLS